MLINLKIDTLPNNVAEAKVIRVYKGAGTAVEAGDILFDIEGGKGSTSIKSNAAGKIQTIKVNEGDTVKAGDLLAVIDGEEAHSNDFVPTAGLDYFGSLLKPKRSEINCDIAIIGGGPGGYVAAIKAAKMGASVVLIEKDTIGGTCLNRGCIPTKSFVRSAEVFRDLKNAANFGCSAEKISVDMKKVVARKNDVVKKLVNGIHFLLDKHKVRTISGTGELRDSRTVYVKAGIEEITIHTKNILIATGSQSSMLKIPGIDNKNVMSSDQILDMENLPKSMVIIGGGVIGMEFASIFSSFGVNVSVVEFMKECLIACDTDVCSQISKIAMKKGIKLYTGAKVEEILPGEDGNCIVVFSGSGGTKKYIPTQKVLVSVGRIPYLNGLGIEKAGIELNENGRGIKVNEKMQTNIPNIYAIGDVTNKVMLAHVASQQGIVAVKNIMGEDCIMDYTAVPSAIFTDPEIAMVGISEKAAKEANIEIEVGKFPFAANGKALAAGDERGFVKIIKEKVSGKIIGGTIIGLHATDLISEITLSVANHLKAEQMANTIYAHPTAAEAVHEASLSLEGGAIHFAQ